MQQVDYSNNYFTYTTETLIVRKFVQGCFGTSLDTTISHTVQTEWIATDQIGSLYSNHSRVFVPGVYPNNKSFYVNKLCAFRILTTLWIIINDYYEHIFFIIFSRNILVIRAFHAYILFCFYFFIIVPPLKFPGCVEFRYLSVYDVDKLILRGYLRMIIIWTNKKKKN